MRFPFYLFGLLFLVLSCHTKKKITTPSDGTIEKPEVAALVNTYINNTLDFTTLEYTAEMQYQGTGMDLGFNGVFRMEKDKMIWGSFKKFGFEAVRLKITPDSLWVLNRLQREAYVDGLDKIQTITGVPLTFQDLEQLLIGGSFFTENLTVVNDTTLSQLQNVKGTKVEAIHIFDGLMNLKKSDIDAQSQGNMSISYDNHTLVDNTNLAFIRDIKAKSGTMAVNLTILTQTVDINAAIATPFEVPSNYTRRSL